MKKTLIVLMLVLLSLVLVVSCDDNANASGGSTSKTYSIGDTGPAGGYIFYVNPNAATDGWTYLEAGKEDLSENYKWGPTGASCSTGTAIGDGLANTKALFEKGSEYAAACAVYKKDIYNNGYTDWFLPSQGELNLMYTNLYKHDPSLGDFKAGTEDSYWTSSSNTSNGYVWFQVFYSGYQSANLATDVRSVRPIRAFN